jgi:hypothetical protein
VIGSGLLEDRCGVCDGDGSSCAPRGAQELCSCDAAVSAPRCNSSTPDSDVDHRPRPAAVGDGQMHEVEGPSATAGQIAIWLSLAGLGLLVVVVIIRPVKFADGSKHTESVRCAKSVVFLNFLIRFFYIKTTICQDRRNTMKIEIPAPLFAQRAHGGRCIHEHLYPGTEEPSDQEGAILQHELRVLSMHGDVRAAVPGVCDPAVRSAPQPERSRDHSRGLGGGCTDPGASRPDQAQCTSSKNLAGSVLDLKNTEKYSLKIY